MHQGHKTQLKNHANNSTSTILMIRPANFGSNAQTLQDNAFQAPQKQTISAYQIHEKALQQFNNFTTQLINNNIQIIIIQDRKQPIKPDAIFPNNWFTTQSNGKIVIFPMKPVSRRTQKTNPVIEQLKKLGYKIQQIIDLSHYENQKWINSQGQNKTGKFLQGTGSMVLDHQNKIAYACKSQRTNQQLFIKYCNQIVKYKPIIFQASDSNNIPYYHTNVIMSICSDFIIICLQSIKNKQQRQIVIKSIKQSKSSIQNKNKQIIQISMQQVNNFCGNVLQVCNKDGQKLLTMSQTAYASFNKEQIQIISKYCKKIVKCDVPTIQKYGGGGTRCTMAQIFLYKN